MVSMAQSRHVICVVSRWLLRSYDGAAAAPS